MGRNHAIRRAAHVGAALIMAMIVYPVVGMGEQPALTKIGPTLHHPWGMDFLDEDTILVTERRGNLFQINLNTTSADQIGNVPEVYHKRQGGLLDVLVEGDWIYLCYSALLVDGSSTAIARARLDPNRLTLIDRTTIFTANQPKWSGHHFGCRLAIPQAGHHAGYLFASLGDRGDRKNAQDPTVHAGSIIRIHPDGRIPIDNPKIDSWLPEIWSIGHRNPQGMAIHPQTGDVWSHEHGPRGGDEINKIAGDAFSGGINYGWPNVSHGREYATGLPVSEHTSLPGFADPEWVWDPSIAPSGMVFYPQFANMFTDLQGQLLVGSLKLKQLLLLRMANGALINEQVLMDHTIGRVRDVAVAPDGSILLLNDEARGALWRISR